MPLKQILLDHNPSVVSATALAAALGAEGFPSKVERDGGTCALNPPAAVVTSKAILDHLAAVSKVRVSAPLKTVTVDHDPALFSAAGIAAKLVEGGFATTVKRDRGQGTDVGVEGRSKFLVTGICCTSKILSVRAILENEL